MTETIRTGIRKRKKPNVYLSMIAVEQLTQKFIRQWHDCPESGYTLVPGIPRKYIDLDFNELFKLTSVKESATEKDCAGQLKKRLMPQLKTFSNEFLLLPNLDAESYSRALFEFVSEAKAFDSGLSENDIYQAGRNVLTMYVIQNILDIAISFTPSVFAYSLLYPYTDNFLDDPEIPDIQKNYFNDHLKQKLSGKLITGATHQEKIIFSLIDMIERQYPRCRYAPVFESLLSIHHAQRESLRLYNNPDLTAGEQLEICIKKGGTSVLADGFLVAGDLTTQQQVTLFGLGIYLQMLDDLQDIENDIQSKISTYFTRYACGQAIDGIVNRFLYFGEQILGRLARPAIPSSTSIHQKLVQLLFLNSARKILPYCSYGYRLYLRPFLKN